MDINPDPDPEPSTSTGRPARKRRANSLYTDFVQIPQNNGRSNKNSNATKNSTQWYIFTS